MSLGDKSNELPGSLGGRGLGRRGFLGAAVVGGAAAAALDAIPGLGQVRNLQAQQRAALQEMSVADRIRSLRRASMLDADVSYLNHASIGTMSRTVFEARAKYLQLCETNPWYYMWSGAWDAAREQTRDRAAELLSVPGGEVAITHNTTEAFNLLAGGLQLGSDDEVLFSTLCHAGASLPFEHQSESGKYKFRRFDFPLNRLPAITEADVIEAYETAIRPETRLLVIPHVDNTVGVRYPVRQIASMARRRGVEFVAVDAAQTVGMLPVDVAQMDVDLLATSPHKWLGAPKGVGLAYIRQNLHEQLRAIWVTWGQQRWAGSARIYEDYGTRNLAEVLTLGDAIAWNQSFGAADRQARLRELWEYTKAKVDQTAGVQWQSPDRWEMGASLVALKLDQPADQVAARLFAEHKIVVRPFKSNEFNHLRVSPNVLTSTTQIDDLLKAIDA